MTTGHWNTQHNQKSRMVTKTIGILYELDNNFEKQQVVMLFHKITTNSSIETMSAREGQHRFLNNDYRQTGHPTQPKSITCSKPLELKCVRQTLSKQRVFMLFQKPTQIHQYQLFVYAGANTDI